MALELWILFGFNILVIFLSIFFAIFVYPKREHSEETKRRPRSFISNAFFREFWYFIMDPLKRKFIEWDTNPNTITFWGLIFSLAAAAAFSAGKFGIAGWMVILSSTCDVYDGQLARARKITLKSGAFFDSTLDRVGESAMFCGMLWFFRDSPTWFFVVFLASAASQLVSYCRARAEGLGFDKGGSRGMFQRAERMIVLSIGMCLAPLSDLFFIEGGLVRLTIFIICAGSVQTALARSIGIYREIRATEPI